jgi:hypothetical protein
MSAKHPITGAPIRIMRTGTQLWKDGKTLSWVQKEHTNQPSHSVNQIITVGLEDAKIFSSQLCIFTSLEPGLKDFLTSSSAKTKNIILLTKATIEELTPEFIKEHTLQNILCLDEIEQLYPHAFDGTPYTSWNGTPEHAVFLVGVILRFAYLAGIPTDLQISNKYITYLPSTTEPKKLWLIQQYYEPEQSRRAKEINFCLQKNIENPYIDKILLLNEKNFSSRLPDSDKIEQIILGHRLRYSDVFRTIYETVPTNTLVAFANSDIYFDDSIKTLWSIKMENKFLALLRYDAESSNEEPKLFGPRPDSQDSWIVLSDSVKTHNADALKDFDFPFGKSGCDNAIAYEMLRKKFLVANPALSIRTIHVHNSEIRNYVRQDIVEKPVFLYLDPTVIQEFQTQTDLKPFKILNEQLYKIPDSFQTKDGLVYGYNSLYIENIDAVKAIWSAKSSKISTLTPYLKFEKSIAIPIDETLEARFTKPEEYVLFYLSRILAIRQNITGPNTAFWGPDGGTSAIDWLRLFSWSEGQNPIPVISRENISQISCKECYYEPFRSETTTPKKADIAALRSAFLYEIDERNTDKKIVIVQSGILTPTLIAELEEGLIKLGYDTYVYYLGTTDVQYIPNVFKNGTILIGSSTGNHYKVFGNMWMMPPGGKVIEFTNNISNTEVESLSVACEHTYVRSTASTTRDVIFAISKIIVQPRITELLPSKPIFKLPTNQQGLHAHVNDSFRELAQLWQEAGFVTIEPTIVPFCSLDGTILYDRPTYKWLDSLPAQLQPPPQQRILVGNPAPKPDTAMQPWIFWARSPRKLQEAVDTNLPNISYKDRTTNCVFIGNVENQFQAATRDISWEAACDKWHLTKGSEYVFSQDEYFQALAASKFGLCLAGYGKKCHREVECMAMGTVLVCSPDVDTDNYAEPLKEGTHFLRAMNPIEAKEKMAAVSESTWETMSASCKAWWARNASVEGSFKVTMANL